VYGPQEPLAALVVQAPVDAGEDVVGSGLGDVVVGDADGLVVVVEVGGVVKTELGGVVAGAEVDVVVW
jgi:regulator of RNase E activity RraA